MRVQGLHFTKWQGTGNDFVVLDLVEHPDMAGLDFPGLARELCDRRYGVGSDGLLLLDKTGGITRMRMFNPDGSEAEMCGNGLRCVARMAVDRAYDPMTFTIATKERDVEVSVEPDGLVSVDMGFAALLDVDPSPLPPYVLGALAVSMGNPHLVLKVEDPEQIDIRHAGPHFERSHAFPDGVNVHFVKLDGSVLTMRPWERGAGATQACGSGACAAAVAARHWGYRDAKLEVRQPGGSVHIELSPDLRVRMSGPAERVFEGLWPFQAASLKNECST